MTVLDQAARLRELVMRHGFGGLNARVVLAPPSPLDGAVLFEDEAEDSPRAEALAALAAGASAEAASHASQHSPAPATAPTSQRAAALADADAASADEPAPAESPMAPAEAGPSAEGSPTPTEAPPPLPLAVVMRPAKASRVVAIASGKGGVGKSHLACNLAIAAARSGTNTVLVDGDLGMANVDVLLGLGGRRHLGEVLDGSAQLDEVVVQRSEGLRIVPGAAGLADLADLDGAALAQTAASLSALEQGAQLLLLDLGAGVGKTVLAFAAAADELIVVTTPEPTAIADAYGLVKVLGVKLPDLRLQLVVNQADSEMEAKAVAQRLQAVVDRFLPHQSLHYLGWVPKDPTVGRAVRAQKAFLEAHPLAPASRAVLLLCEQLLGRPVGKPPGGLVARLLGAWRQG